MAEEEKNKEKEEKKIIVDEDWKNEAQKDKEQVSADEKKEKEQEKEQKGGEAGRRGPLPKGNFAALLSMLTTQALFAMGVLKVKDQEKKPDLELAKYHIDMLEALEEKTKGNLSEEEKKVFDDTLSQVRMAYVKVGETK